MSAKIHAAVVQYQKDHDADQLSAAILAILRVAYEDTGADEEDIDDALDEQKEYLAGFMQDVDNDKLSDDQMDARALLYAGSVYAFTQLTNLRAAASEADPTAVQTWHTDPNAEHCEDCEALDGVQHTAQEWLDLGLYPGCGQNQCLGNCRCGLD